MASSTLFTWLKSLWNAPSKWSRRSRTERRLLVEAFFSLGVARMLVLTVPFRWLAGSLGKHMHESDREIDAAHLQHARLIGQAVRSAANNTPWQSVCLPQAVTAQWMLKRRRITATYKGCRCGKIDGYYLVNRKSIISASSGYAGLGWKRLTPKQVWP